MLRSSYQAEGPVWTCLQGGFIWLFWGSKSLPADERPPIPFVPELEDPAWRPVYGSIEFNCPHWGVFENAIDMAHIHYLHSGTFGNQDRPEIRSMTCSTDDYGAYASFSLHNKPVNALWDFSKVRAKACQASPAPKGSFDPCTHAEQHGQLTAHCHSFHEVDFSMLAD